MRIFRPLRNILATGAVAAAIFAFSAVLHSFALHAEEVPLFSEIRFGVLASDLEPGGGSDGDVALSMEFLSPRNDYAGLSLMGRLFSPRIHAGGVLALEDGVNQLYAGFTWDVYLMERVFVEAGLGGAVHDGETAERDGDSYGCALNFRESLSVGADLTDDMSIMATVDHMSNAGLCGEN